MFTALNGQCWFETDGVALLQKPVCYSESDVPGEIQSSQDGSVLAVSIQMRPTGFSALLDLNGKGGVTVYTRGTHLKLLTVVPKEREGGDFALSLDGSLLCVLRGEKLSLYAVPHS
jgi:hypothetical protein